MAFLFTWLRFSAQKLLTWSRRSNYQSKDIAWVQKVTAERVSDKVRAPRGVRIHSNSKAFVIQKGSRFSK
jgi:hypothetical protein